MQYGRNIDVNLPDDGTEQYVAIDLDEDAESVRADFSVSGTFNSGSADATLYVFGNKGDFREVTDSDSGSFTQLGSVFSVSDTNAHELGALLDEGNYGFAIIGFVSSADATGLSVSGDFIDNTHPSVPDGRSALEHATNGALSNEVYTDGTAQ